MKVNEAAPAAAYKQIVRFEVSMNETNFMKIFQHVQHFYGVENAQSFIHSLALTEIRIDNILHSSKCKLILESSR